MRSTEGRADPTQQEQQPERQQKAAAFWQRTIDEGRMQRQTAPAEQVTQAERQENSARQERSENHQHRLSM